MCFPNHEQRVVETGRLALGKNRAIQKKQEPAPCKAQSPELSLGQCRKAAFSTVRERNMLNLFHYMKPRKAAEVSNKGGEDEFSLQGSGGWEGAGCLQNLCFNLNQQITTLWEICFSSRYRDR